MPLIYRAMLRDGQHPAIGPNRKCLGVQVPGDIVEEGGLVKPHSGGMSVSPGWRNLPMHRVPRRLKHLATKATGGNQYECWRMGEGPFEASAISAGLRLRLDRPGHGLVEPDNPMTPSEYQHHLAATRERWIIEEETRA